MLGSIPSPCHQYTYENIKGQTMPILAKEVPLKWVCFLYWI